MTHTRLAIAFAMFLLAACSADGVPSSPSPLESPKIGAGCPPGDDGLACTETLVAMVEDELGVALTRQEYGGDEASTFETDALGDGALGATVVTVIGDEAAADRLVLTAAGEVTRYLDNFERILESVAPGAGTWARGLVEETVLTFEPPAGDLNETRVFGEATAVLLVFPNENDAPPRRAIVFVVVDDDGCDQPGYTGAYADQPCE